MIYSFWLPNLKKKLEAIYHPIAPGWISDMIYKNGNYTTLYTLMKTALKERSLLQLPASSSPTSTRVVYYLRIRYKKNLKFSLWNQREMTCPVRPRGKTKIKKWKATCNNNPERYDLTGRYLSVLWKHSFDTFFKMLRDFHWKSCWFSTTLAGRLLRSQSLYELLLQSCLAV